MSQLTQRTFDYNGMKAPDIKRCESAVTKIGAKQRRIAADIIDIGKELIAVKERLPHGMFGSWLDHHFGWSQQSASNMMRAALQFGKVPKFGDLTIDQSALYLLSSDSCPDEVREEVLDTAKSGERITHKQVKEAIAADRDEEDDDIDEPEPEYSLEQLIVDARRLSTRARKDLDDEFVAEVFGDISNQIRKRIERAQSAINDVATAVDRIADLTDLTTDEKQIANK